MPNVEFVLIVVAKLFVTADGLPLGDENKR
jgi:hypothetical protein